MRVANLLPRQLRRPRALPRLLAVCAVCSACAADFEDRLVAERQPSLGSARLRDLSSSTIPVIGAAVRTTPALTHAQYAATLATHYNQVTPEVALKWEALRPSASEYRFTDADALIALAEANGQSVRGHTLVWEVNLPAWLNDSLGPAGVRDAMRSHIGTVVTRYRGRIAHWDVVNEALTSGGTYRDNVFTRAMGPAYVAEAFGAAHAADPVARLAYNDFDLEKPGLKQDAAFAMLRDLRAAGVPVHEVGLQLHVKPYDWVNRRVTEQMVRAAMARFGSLGLDVYVTELDAPIDQLSGPEPTRLELQRQVYWAIAAACFGEPACQGITTWGFTDQYTWLANARPLPFDTSFVAKPAADGLAAGLLGQAAPPLAQPWDTSCWALAGALFCEPMESDTLFGLTQVSQAGGQVATMSSGAYRGGLALRATAPSASAVRRGYIERRVTGTGSTIWSRAHVLVSASSPNDLSVLAFDEPRSPFYGVSVGLDPSGRVFLRVGGAAPTRALGPAFPKGRWVCAELRVAVADVGGAAELFLDGTRVGLLSNVDTRFASGYGTFKAGVVWSPANGPTAEVWADELVVSATRPGCR